ncbi:hypothetical protein PORY_002305 [Pneumocystis oryctolagi]|uniref:Uncharacterized protein n=1 Tax=Pneumocystis oryctolagi TaxID=42067 RepID=A0ACB7CBB1_9ASCO|nr:hypothetical protein PORY_002305 [Pneumocystis oryctolagi]
MENTSIFDEASDEQTIVLGEEFDQYAMIFDRYKDSEIFGETGLLSKYYMYGQKRLDELMDSEHYEDSLEIEQWDLECKTWDLVQRLYSHRVQKPSKLPSVHEYSSNVILEEAFYTQNPEAMENTIVLNWLKDIFPEPSLSEISGKKWLYTRENIRMKRLQIKSFKEDRLIDELDPDAPTRQQKLLDDKDSEFERKFLRDLFLLIRCGDFDKACDICKETGNFLRSAILQGCIEYRDPLIDENNAELGVMGTKRKQLWKKMCYELSKQTELDPYERALYGVLSGDLQSVLQVCETWEDYLWAYCNSICEHQITTNLKHLGKIKPSQDLIIPNVESISLSSVLENLIHSDNELIRNVANEPMRIIQSSIITSKIDELISNLNTQLQDIQNGTSSVNIKSIPSFLRFIVHFILLLRQANISINENHSNNLICAYIELLAAGGKQDIVPLYVAQLPHDMSIEVYAKFLSNIDDDQQRIDQLHLATKYKLDMLNSLRRIVDIVYSTALINDDFFNSFTVELIPITDEPSEWDLYQIRALEWMKSLDDLKYDIIYKGNILYRRFLLRGKLNAAQTLNLRLSSSILITRDMVENEDSSEQDKKFRYATEYLGYSSLCIGYMKYENWKNIMSNGLNDIKNKSDFGKKQWKLDVQRAVEECVSTFYELIQGNWLHPDILLVSESEDPVTYNELMKIRNIYIPELVCLLHKVYYDTHTLFPRNLHACMELSCLVADEDKKIYETFLITHRMPEYLKMLRHASIAMLGSYHSKSNESLWNNVSDASFENTECSNRLSGFSDRNSCSGSVFNHSDSLVQYDTLTRNKSTYSLGESSITSCSFEKRASFSYPFHEMSLRALAIAGLGASSPFAFTAEQLQTFIDPRNIEILRIIGGIKGLCLGLHTDPILGLSIDEKCITERVSLKDLMNTNDYSVYEKIHKAYKIKNRELKLNKKRKSNKEYLFVRNESDISSSDRSFDILDDASTVKKSGFVSKILKCLKKKKSYITMVVGNIMKILHFIAKIILKVKFIRIMKEVLIGKSETYKDFIDLYGDSYKTRIAIFGINRTPKHHIKGIIPLLFCVFRDPMLILLICASIISFGIDIYHKLQIVYHNNVPEVEDHSSIDGLAIFAAIIVVSFVTALNDYQKEVQFEKLNSKKNDFQVKIIRSGKPMNISVYQLQVGDILLFELGDLLSADGVLIDGYNVSCDESSSTGESNTIEKMSCSLSLSNTSHKVMFDERYDPFMISGSRIVEGTGKYVVTSVGMHSYYEKIMASIQDESDETPLQIKLNKFALGITKFGILISLLLFNILFCRFLINFPESKKSSYEKTMDFMKILISSITIIVVALPEGLPLAITLALAFATKKMFKENNLVRRLKSCETMGNVTTICSDKTGTLTQNKMVLVVGTLSLSAQFQDHSNLEIDEKNSLNEMEIPNICNLSMLLNPCVKQLIIESIVVNSSAFLSTDQQGQRIFVGPKTDCAFLEFAQKYLNMDDLNTERANANVLQFIPFSSSRKYMASIVSLPNGGARLYIKGASEVLLERSSYILDDPFSKELDHLSISPLSQKDKELIYETIVKYASLSLRTIALVYRDFDVWPIDGSQELLNNLDINSNTIFSQMTFIGVVGIMDPLRNGVKDAIKMCKNAGITVRMVTGDNKITAEAIAKSCGIYTPGGILMEGVDFRKLSPEDMNIIAPRLQVLARSSPKDKKILVSKLKELGEVVAVTGDGTNDGPALKKADVGFSMGLSGTEVAKEASDIILMDDNFSSIVNACAWGRAINLSIKKFLQFQITVNLTAVLLAFITAIVDPDLRPVLNPVQLLWVNLIMDSFAALALATDPPSSTILTRKPDSRESPLITFSMWKMIIGHSIYQLSVTLLLHFLGRFIFNEKKAFVVGTLPTLVFNTFVFMQVFNQFNCWRLNNDSSIMEGFRSNPWYVSINIIMILGQVMIVSFGNEVFHVKPLNFLQWIISVSLGALSIPISILIDYIPDDFLRKMLPSFIEQENLVSNNTINQTQWHLSSLCIKDELAFLRVLKHGHSVSYFSRCRRMNEFYKKLAQSIHIKNQDIEKAKKKLFKNKKLCLFTLGAATIAPSIMAGSIGACVSNNLENDVYINDSLLHSGIEVYSDVQK